MTATSHRLRLIEGAVLLAVLVGLALVGVQSHYSTIWADREFTGWVAPIAERFASGQKLYTYGGHSPMPPLAFVSVYLLSGGEPTWLHSSVLNAIMQGLTLVVLYAGMSQHLRSPVPFLATATAVPLFFALPKTIVYDSMAQFFAATACVLAMAPLRASPPRVRPRTLVLAAVVTALCLLSKNSTGAGVFLSLCLFFGVLPAKKWTDRAQTILCYAGASVAFGVVLSLALMPFMSLSGFFNDVFLTGSEPKGGVGLLARHLSTYGVAFGSMAIRFGVLAFAATLWVLERPAVLPGARLPTRAHAVLLFVLGIAAWLGYPTGLALPPAVEAWAVLPALCLELGLMLGLSFAVRAFFCPWLLPPPPSVRAVGALAMLALPVAITHNLSVGWFRWTYDNNPVIVAALAAAFLPICTYWGQKAASKARTALVLCVLGAVTVGFWAGLSEQVQSIATTTESWPEIRHLAGARMPPSGRGVRELVAKARALAPGQNDTVLLLPEDPNLAAWFERPRPALSSAMLFVDQYWDRYVEDDFQRLVQNPPKVLLIGPRSYWRRFHQIWHTNWGVDRLLDLIIRDLLPMRYRLHSTHPIQARNRPDSIQVFVRVD